MTTVSVVWRHLAGGAGEIPWEAARNRPGIGPESARIGPKSAQSRRDDSTPYRLVGRLVV